MINNILNELVLSAGFNQIFANENSVIFSRLQGDSRRYIILKFEDNLGTVDEVHQTINDLIPQEVKDDPAYHKNTDLIIVVKFHLLDDFRSFEQKIFSLEEDAFFFKKYVLYYTDTEEGFLTGKHLRDLNEVILDKELFKQYKASPNMPSLYGIAAKIFIKFPFIELPVSESLLTPLNKQAPELVSQLGLNDLNKLISNTPDDSIDTIIKELILDEMENI
jgi:hypothetical protein